MALIVQKFGGSSLVDDAALRQVARQLVARHRAGDALVVVVSAMGRTTSHLMAQAAQQNPAPPPRELDMLLTAGERISMALLAMAIAAEGGSAISLTGSQSGIITDSKHNQAAIVAVRPERVLAGLAAREIVVVAGYQGVSSEREVTTLGRGGSDTTAVALGAALHADAVELCSDVAGIYSADPNVCLQARLLKEINYAPMRLLGWLGARVLKPEATAFAERAGIDIIARHNTAKASMTRIGPTRTLPRPALAVAHVARGAYVQWDGEPASIAASQREVMALAQALTGQVMMSTHHTMFVSWVHALPEAHKHFEERVLHQPCTIRAAASVSVVGDDLLQKVAHKAHHALDETGIEIWSQLLTPFHLTYIIDPNNDGCARAVSCLHPLTAS